MLKPIGVVSISIALAIAQSAAISPARADGCTVAVLDYNYILPKLTDAMEKFSTCVADSKGNDKCANEYNELRAEYAQFADAVANYKKECL